MKHFATIDFETHGIQGRPVYPPKPVGVAIKYSGKKARYYAWGHASKNNCEMAAATKALMAAVDSGLPLVFHNAKFDVDVMETHMGRSADGLWPRIHDTLFLLFLHDPHAAELGLKPSAERLLNWKPEERDAVGAWLLAKQPVPGVRISAAPKSPHYYGRYISEAPGDLVGKYAIGDVDRTEALFKLLHPKIVEAGMLEAYDRERKLLPVLLGMERRGVEVNMKRLEADVAKYEMVESKLTVKLRSITGVSDLNPDSPKQLVQALLKKKLVDKKLLGVTPKSGQPKTDKDSLQEAIKDEELKKILLYRSNLQTCLHTFMEPWLKTAKRSGGLIFTQWNQIRHHESGGNTGARTGRLSSKPNFQNIPKAQKHEVPKNCPPLPLVRSYIVAPKGHVLIDRDYSQQELRILAHFEDGTLLAAYNENPRMDVHDFAKSMIESLLQRRFERGPVKTVGFGLIYGMGLARLAEKNDCSIEEAKELKAAYLKTFPGLREIYQDMKQRAAEDRPLRTWGGRLYYCEPPKIVDGKLRTYDYKMVNVLIQGSAADCTKEALIRYETLRPKTHIPLLNVHDQILCAVPKREIKRGHAILRKAMESVEFSLPMLSDGKWSATNWQELEKYEEGGSV